MNRQLRAPAPQAPDAEGAPLVSEGAFPARFLPVSGTASLEAASPESLGRIAAASLLLAVGERRRVLLGASQLILDRALGLGEPVDLAALEPEGQAALLDALSVAPAELRERYRKQGRALADELVGAPTAARVLAAGALLRRANALQSAELRGSAMALLGDLGNLDLGQRGALRLLGALVEGGGEAAVAAQRRLEAWAQERLLSRAAYSVEDLSGLATLARIAKGHPQGADFRVAALAAAEEVLALQLMERHAPFVRDISLAVGGFRDDLTRLRIPLGHSAECLLALYEAQRLLGGGRR